MKTTLLGLVLAAAPLLACGIEINHGVGQHRQRMQMVHDEAQATFVFTELAR